MGRQREQWGSRARPWRRFAVVGVALAGAFGWVALVDPSVGVAGAATCRAATDAGSPSSDPSTLTAAFAGAPDGLEGADYQRAIDLRDGRRLWTFQDAFVARPGRSDALVHNVAVVEHDGCFDLIRGGSARQPAPWLAAAETVRFQRWFWPMSAVVPGDGTVRVFLAEFVERGRRYLARATPVATWVATVDATTFEQRALDPAPNPGSDLYGWSAVRGAHHTFLYAHCYRQFGNGPLGHDPCTRSVTVARTSHDLTAPLEYWDGARWTADASTAANVAPPVAPDGRRRDVNPSQYARVGSRWISVTKEGDWWGDRIYVDVALKPTGPWTTVQTIDVPAETPAVNNYFASIVEVTERRVVIGLSHNRWDGVQSSVYRPTFTEVQLPAAARPRSTVATPNRS